nr:MAG TPA: hypothetical protein [Caudoviricetes sp.]
MCKFSCSLFTKIPFRHFGYLSFTSKNSLKNSFDEPRFC